MVHSLKKSFVKYELYQKVNIFSATQFKKLRVIKTPIQKVRINLKETSSRKILEMTTPSSFLDINQFEKIFLIGSGATSNVYRVRELATGKYFAAKVSKFRISSKNKDDEKVHFLFREINLMSLLNHPSIIKFIGYSQKNFDNHLKPTIISEYATNGSLRDIINMESAGLSPDDWNFTKKLINIYGIASGLLYLHSHNFIHRDLKPKNILLDDYLYPKISDFGLSKITEQILSDSMNFQSQKAVKGTPIYIAPEVMRTGNYSTLGDVYSFGYIVFEILTSENPFEGFNYYELMKKVAIDGKRPDIKNYIPNVYKNLIERCWSHYPENRPSFNEIVNELKNNNEFITELVDESEFYDYVDFIDTYKDTFDVSKQLIHFADFINVHGRNKKLKEVVITRNNKMENEQEENEDIKDNESDEIFFFPSSEFTKLNKSCQNFVESAQSDPIKQFVLGKLLIKGKNNFPKNIHIGFQYIKQSIKNNCLDAKLFYIEHLIKGKIILQNINEAERYLNELTEINDCRINALWGKLNNKLNQFFLSKKYFKKGAKEGDQVCMYKYGKFLFLTNKNINKAIKYITRSKDLGYKKSEYFLISFNLMKNIKGFTYLPSETQLFFISKIVKIFTKNNNLRSENIDKFDELHISFKEIEKKFYNKSLKISTFSKCLKLFRDIYIEIEYPSISFKPISDLIIKIKNKNNLNIIIGMIFAKLPIFNTDDYADYFLANFTYYKIKDTIDNIPLYSFDRCKFLSKLIIPSSVKSIGNFAFSQCSSLEKITIPSSVTSIGNFAFNKCVLLKKITIPSSVTSIGSNAFKECSSLTQITTPSSLTSINYSVFSGCSSLTQIEIPSSVTSIKDFAFFGCSSLAQIEIPSSVTSIKESAFERCYSLKQIIIPSSVTSIEDSAFEGCSSLKQIIIPSFVTYIGSSSFSRCFSLTSISIPSSCTSIGISAFSKCTSLTQIIIPSSISFISHSSFSGCSSLINISIPSSVKSIGEYCFEDCISLEQFSIPSSVTFIGEYAFANCSSLKQITIPSSVRVYNINMFDGIDNIEITYKVKVLPFYIYRESLLNEITIPSSIKYIDNNAFERCTSLTRISIPSSVISTGFNVFSECISLTEVIFDENSSLKNIGMYAFYKCKSLKQMIIPSSVTSIEHYAFEECSSLSQIIIPSSVTSIGNYAFNKCTSLNQILIPSSVTLLGDYAFNECSLLRKVSLSTSLSSIGNYTFNKCISLIDISIPLSVVIIDKYAFNGCSSLEQISIPSSIFLIGDFAFSECSSLTQIKIPPSVSLLGHNVFNGCKSLKQISIPASINGYELGLHREIDINII